MRRLIGCFLLGFSSCCSPSVFLDPYSFAPCLPNAVYDHDTGESSLISSAYFHTYLPLDYEGETLSLATLIDIALYNNPNTKTSWAEARAQAALYAQANSAYFPTVDACVSYQKERETFSLSENFTVPYRLETTGPEINLNYTLLDFGKRNASSAAALQGLLFADLSHNRTLQSAVKTVMEDYYTCAFEKERLVALEADLANAEQTMRAAEEKGALGIVARGDVAQAKTAFIQAKIRVIQQERDLALSFSQLAKDVGLPATATFAIEELPENVFSDTTFAQLEELVDQAQRQRPDLQAALAGLEQQKAALAGARAEYNPTLSASFDLGKYWYNHNEDEDYHWTLLLKLNVPLFEGFLRNNVVREKRANLEKSAAELLNTELTVISEVTSAHASLKAAKEALAYSNEYVQEAALQFSIAFESYKAGTVTILDLLSSQSAVADAKAELANAKKDWYQSIAEIAYSTGALGIPYSEPPTTRF